MRLTSLHFTPLLILQALASPSPFTPNGPQEHRPFIPAGWTPIRRAPPFLVLPLRIGLVQPNLDRLESFWVEVSHPESLSYGRHWTAEEVAGAFRPSQESSDTIQQWLMEDGIADSRVELSGTGGWVMVKVTVEEAEHLLNTTYYEYEQTSSGIKHIACEREYYLPQHVSRVVDLISPTLHFDVPSKRGSHNMVQERRASVGKSIGNPGASVVSLKTKGRVPVRELQDPIRPILAITSYIGDIYEPSFTM